MVIGLIVLGIILLILGILTPIGGTPKTIYKTLLVIFNLNFVLWDTPPIFRWLTHAKSFYSGGFALIVILFILLIIIGSTFMGQC